MPPLSQHHSATITKLLYIGESGAGKTGSLAALAAAGFKLWIIDLDNGIDVLSSYLSDPSSEYVKKNPKAIENVNYVTLTDPMRNANGRLIPAKATVWQRTINQLIEWKDGEQSFGKITDFGSNDIIVIDSLSMLSVAALNFHLSMNAALGATRTQNEGRRDIGSAQNLIRDLLVMLYDSNIKCNIIVTSHLTFVNEAGGKPGESDTMSVSQGYPSAIGRALSPHIPRWFNNMLIARTVGAGSGAKHEIYTSSQNIGGQLVNAKNSAPLKVKPKYPLEWGLSEFFKDVRG